MRSGMLYFAYAGIAAIVLVMGGTYLWASAPSSPEATQEVPQWVGFPMMVAVVALPVCLILGLLNLNKQRTRPSGRGVVLLSAGVVGIIIGLFMAALAVNIIVSETTCEGAACGLGLIFALPIAVVGALFFGGGGAVALTFGLRMLRKAPAKPTQPAPTTFRAEGASARQPRGTITPDNPYGRR